MLKIAAHTLCRFGQWFGLQRSTFELLNAPRTESLATEHQRMHDAIRSIWR